MTLQSNAVHLVFCYLLACVLGLHFSASYFFLLNRNHFFKDIFGGFLSLYLIGQLKSQTRSEGKRDGRTCSKGPQGGIEPMATATRSQPLYMGCLLYHQSYKGAPWHHNFIYLFIYSRSFWFKALHQKVCMIICCNVCNIFPFKADSLHLKSQLFDFAKTLKVHQDFNVQKSKKMSCVITFSVSTNSATDDIFWGSKRVFTVWNVKVHVVYM